MKKILVLMAIFMVILALPIAADPFMTKPDTVLDTMFGAGAVISSAMEMDRLHSPLRTEAIVLALAVIVAAAITLGIHIYASKSNGHQPRRRMIHFARDQPSGA